MAHLQSTTISGSNNDTGSLQITGSTFMPPQIESALTSSFTASGLLWINADNGYLQYTTETSKGTIQSPASFMGAWSTGGSLSTARYFSATAGTQNAALSAGGCASGLTQATEEYDGSAWASGGNLAQNLNTPLGMGTQNAALAMGRYQPAGGYCGCVEEYNGSTWSTGGALITARGYSVGAGTQNAGLAAGGHSNSPAGVKTSCAEQYNGVSWSAITALPASKVGGIGIGNANSFMFNGGDESGITTNVDEWNGITWFSQNNISQARSMGAGGGTTSEGVIMGGNNPGKSDRTEEWNGLTWVNSCSIPVGTSHTNNGVIGTQSSTLLVGGCAPTTTGQTLEYTKNDIVPYTARVWSSAGGVISARCQYGWGGGQDGATMFGGVTNATPYSNVTELYDGSGWTTGPNMIVGRRDITSAGTQNSTLAFFGYTGAALSCTEEYNGSSWSAGGSTIIARQAVAGMGLQDAAVGAGGYPNTTKGTCVEEYNGTSWSTGGALIICRESAMQGSGTQNAGLVTGGGNSGGNLTSTEEYDGSTWSAGGTLSGIQLVGGQTGTQNASTIFGGQTNPTFTISSSDYDGTSWAVTGNMLVARTGVKGGGTQNSAIAGPGRDNDLNKVTCVEEYSAVCSTTMCSAAGAWSVTNKNITPRTALGFSGTGTQNAVWLAGGGGPGLPSPNGTNATELYDGASWTTGNNIIYACFGRAGGGTQNAGLLIGGLPFTTATEEFNGSTWSIGGSMSNSLYCRTAGGLQNDALAFGGSPGQTCTEEYNGTSWSAGGAFPITPGGIGTKVGGAVGTTVNDIISTARTSDSVSAKVTQYDGTSWSELTSKNSKRSLGGAAGTTSAAVVFGGYLNPGAPPYNCSITYTEEWNGATWSHGRNTNTSTTLIGGAGSQDAAIMQAGNSYTGYTEEFTCTTSGNCIGAWSAGGALITARFLGASTTAGSQNSTLSVGGRTPGTVTCTEEYDGSSWTAGGAMIIARGQNFGFGTQNATVTTGGATTFPTAITSTEHYDGTSWSAETALPTARRGGGSAGTQNAGLIFGGVPGVTATCEYDGSSWTSGGNLINGSNAVNFGSFGTQNAAIRAGGDDNVNPVTCTEEYNGSTWAAGGALPSGRCGSGGAGTLNAGFIIGGSNYPTNEQTITSFKYDGFVWSFAENLNNRTRIPAGSDGTTSAAIIAGGSNPSTLSCTELYNCNTLLGAGITYKRNEVSVS